MIVAAKHAGNGKLYLLILRGCDIKCGFAAFAFKPEHTCRVGYRLTDKPENDRAAFGASVCYMCVSARSHIFYISFTPHLGRACGFILLFYNVMFFGIYSGTVIRGTNKS